RSKIEALNGLAQAYLALSEQTTASNVLQQMLATIDQVEDEWLKHAAIGLFVNVLPSFSDARIKHDLINQSQVVINNIQTEPVRSVALTAQAQAYQDDACPSVKCRAEKKGMRGYRLL
ncbi:MAG: hypothetical protein AAGM36_19895, partial [Cyanobacteria bacterium J06597_1]